MSPKPVNVPRAVETLRRETPGPEATEALLQALYQPTRRRSIARPLAFGLVATALALAIVFPPRTKAGSAWAQTLSNSIDVPATHSVSMDAKGVVNGEYWQSGGKSATVLLKNGKPMMEMRGNGKRRLVVFDWMGWNGRPAANAQVYGVVMKDWPLERKWEVSYASLEQLLKRPGLRVISHEEAKDGKPEQYRLVVKTYRENEIVAEIDPAVRRIAAVVEPKSGSRTVIDYPASIPGSIFEPRPQALPKVPVYDHELLGKKIQQTLRKGIATKGPVTLRAVLLDSNGALWAFWTGMLPDKKLSHPFSIPGVATEPPFSNKIYTTAWKESPKMNGVPLPASSPRFGGMARVPKSKLGSAVNLDVPYPGGVAHFRNAPIIRIGLIQNVDSVLGVKRDYR